MSTSDTSSRPSAKFVLVITANIDGSPSYSDGYILWSHSSDLERFVFNSIEEARACASTHETGHLMLSVWIAGSAGSLGR